LTFIKSISTYNVDDNVLLKQFKNDSNQEALSALFFKYVDLVFGVCLKYLQDGEKSKDAVMEIYEELTIKLKKHEVSNFKSWLHVLTKNHCLMKLRKSKNIKHTELTEDFVQIQQNEHPLAELLDKEENLKKMEHCLEKLTQEQRVSIELFYLQQKCYNEIVNITGYEWQMVRSFVQNGKRNLRNCMEDSQ
jgi:RNA polymerase sigma factor (sigma-70 family)